MSKIQEFGDKIAIYENEVINFMIKSPLFFDQDQLLSIIKSYFITRRDLTQKEVRKLTGLSAGKISQELNSLKKMGLIEESNISKTGEITYSMKSIQKSFLRSSVYAMSQVSKSGKIFKKIKNELEKNKDKYKNLIGYKEISKLVNLLSLSIPLNEKLISTIKDLIDS